ncbi:MAG TPA: hypothetical protein DDW76_22270 [Cyanobacteria bacterium UBA11369]|nr:hypothetical protein [Cyanobacteria bacterium UBA11371]HBE51425.1 hypothetical protein [Cyanobacteria bacterium UBA11369]
MIRPWAKIALDGRNCRFHKSHWVTFLKHDQLPITNYQLPITNYQLPITNYPIKISPPLGGTLTQLRPGSTAKGGEVS